MSLVENSSLFCSGEGAVRLRFWSEDRWDVLRKLVDLVSEAERTLDTFRVRIFAGASSRAFGFCRFDGEASLATVRVRRCGPFFALLGLVVLSSELASGSSALSRCLPPDVCGSARTVDAHMDGGFFISISTFGGAALTAGAFFALAAEEADDFRPFLGVLTSTWTSFRPFLARGGFSSSLLLLSGLVPLSSLVLRGIIKKRLLPACSSFDVQF